MSKNGRHPTIFVFQAGSVAESLDTSESVTVVNDESVTLLNETVTIQEGFSDAEDDYALLDDLEIDGDFDPANVKDVSLG